MPFNLRVMVGLHAYEISFEDTTAEFIRIKRFF